MNQLPAFDTNNASATQLLARIRPLNEAIERQVIGATREASDLMYQFRESERNCVDADVHHSHYRWRMTHALSHTIFAPNNGAFATALDIAVERQCLAYRHGYAVLEELPCITNRDYVDALTAALGRTVPVALIGLLSEFVM